MITVFNRVKLFTDASAEAAAKVWSTLRAKGIPYEMKTLQNHGTFGRNLHYRSSMSFGHGGLGAAPFADQILYTYVIYVRRKDEARAREICHLPESK